MNKSKKSIVITLLTILTIGLIASADAQELSRQWSDPELLYLVSDGLRSNYISIISDRASKVYTWWATFDAYPETRTGSQPKSSTFHAQNIRGEWRSPTDVMVWPDAGRMTSVILDDKGILHAFSSTDCLYYSKAYQDQAMSAQGWSNVGCLDETGITFPSAEKAPDGIFYVVYSTLGNHSYRLIKSADSGSTWSSYKTILEEEDFLLDPMIAIDHQGRLHLVWSVGQAPDAYPPLGVFYSRSDDGGSSWTPPFQLGGMDEGEPAIAVYEDEVHVLWNGDAAKRGRYYRYSPNAGETWGGVEILSAPSDEGGKGGLQRPPALIVDNIGDVHALLHEQEELYYSTKTEFGWSPKESLYNSELMKGVEIFGVRLAITDGNILHSLYILESYDQSDSEDRRNHIWRVFHQTREIDARYESPSPWPPGVVEQNEIDANLSPTIEPELSITALASNSFGVENDLQELNDYNPAWSIYISAISVSLFIVSLLVYFFIKLRN